MDQLSFLEEVLQGRVGEVEAKARDAAVAAGLGHFFEKQGLPITADASSASDPQLSGGAAVPPDSALATPRPASVREDDSAAGAPSSTSAVATGVAPQSKRERLKREAAAALSAQLSEALVNSTSRDDLDAVPDVAAQLRVRMWLLNVLRKVRA